MIIRYSPVFLKTLKNLDVRIKKSFKEKALIFSKNPHDHELNNHSLREPYLGLRSIDVTSDWRVVYKEKQEGEEDVALFVLIGTHNQLFKNKRLDES